jgi:hypothetical protein
VIYMMGENIIIIIIIIVVLTGYRQTMYK